MQIFMQIYSKYPDLGSMLQLGDYAAYMQQHAATCAFQLKNIKKYKNITQLQKSMPKRATVYQLSDMLPFLLVCSKYAANMLQNQILEEAHLLILICHAKKPLYTHFHALITICSVWLILAPTILYYHSSSIIHSTKIIGYFF